MDHFSGRVLSFAGREPAAQRKMFSALDHMCRIAIVRRDTRTEQCVVVPFCYGVTLLDLYWFLGLPPYSEQWKVYDDLYRNGTRRA